MEKQENSKNVKWFDLGVILTITSNRKYAKLDDVCETLQFLINDLVYTHQLPRVADTVQPYILSLYPELEGVGVHEIIQSKEEALNFVASQKEIFGDSLPLSRLPEELIDNHIDPVEELIQMKSERNAKILVIK